MAATDIEGNTVPRECLITTGATAPFTDLIKAAFDCLDTFKELGYTRITFQAGDGLPYFHKIKPDDFRGIDVEAYAFSDGLYSQMRGLKSKTDSNGISELEEGLVITHAGSGTILDAMRLGLPLIVVPNTSLLDNHQQELADELEAQGYVTKSDCQSLSKALKLADERAKAATKKLQNAESNAKKPDYGSELAALEGKQGFRRLMNSIVGYEDDLNSGLD